MRANRPFTIVVIAAALLRLVVMLGYPPAMFFNDSYNYMTDAVTKTPTWCGATATRSSSTRCSRSTA